MESDAVKTGMQQAPHRSLLDALDITGEEMGRPLVGIVSSYNKIVPGHMNLDKIVDAVRLDVAMTGGIPVVFPAITVYDNIAMGHIGAEYSLVTQGLIADSTECMALAHQFDTLVMMPNCDKNVPGLLMVATRINVSAVFVSGGPILAGHVGRHKTSLSSMFEAVGTYTAGNMSEGDMEGFENKACLTCSSCSDMYTANSISCLTEVLGIGLKGNDTIPTVYSERIKLAKHTGMKVMEVYKKSVCPRDITIGEAFMSALTMDVALGYSTNSMLHLPAITHKADMELNVDITNEISARTPNLCHLVPARPTYIEDSSGTGGVYAVMKEISKKGLLNLDCMTVTSRIVGENVKDYVNRNLEVTRPVEDPYSQIGGIAIPKDNLAPNSTVVKRSAVAPEVLKHEGPARVFDYEEGAINVIKNGRVIAGDAVVIRYEGSKGGPGMREMLSPASAIAGMGLGSTMALVANGCFSGASRGASIGHASPEAAVGGPIALVGKGDIVSINIDDHELNVLVSDQEMEARKVKWQPRTPQVTIGYLARYVSLVTSADRGAVLQVK